MKKSIATLLILSFLLACISGCGKAPATPTSVPTNTTTPTDTPESTVTPVPTDTPPSTPYPTNSPTPVATDIPIPTVTATPTLDPSATPTSTPTDTPTFTPEPTATNAPLPTGTSTPVPTATNTPAPTSTPAPTHTVPTPTNTPTDTPIPTYFEATSTPRPTSTPDPEVTPVNAGKEYGDQGYDYKAFFKSDCFSGACGGKLGCSAIFTYDYAPDDNYGILEDGTYEHDVIVSYRESGSDGRVYFCSVSDNGAEIFATQHLPVTMYDFLRRSYDDPAEFTGDFRGHTYHFTLNTFCFIDTTGDGYYDYELTIEQAKMLQLMPLSWVDENGSSKATYATLEECKAYWGIE